jgi:hypothetical protein
MSLSTSDAKETSSWTHRSRRQQTKRLENYTFWLAITDTTVARNSFSTTNAVRTVVGDHVQRLEHVQQVETDDQRSSEDPQPNSSTQASAKSIFLAVSLHVPVQFDQGPLPLLWPSSTNRTKVGEIL